MIVFENFSAKIRFSLRNRLILSVYILTFAVGLFCAWQSIETARVKLAESSYETALNGQFAVGFTIKKMTEGSKFTVEDESLYLLATVRNSAISYTEYNSGASFKISNDEVGQIYSSIADELLPQLALSPKKDGAVSYFMKSIGDKTYIFVSSYIKIYRTMFKLDYVLDITGVNILLKGLAGKIVLILFLAEIFLFAALNQIIKSSLKPLDMLNGHASKIAAGDYETRVGIVRNDEVGQLAESINHMTDAIEENITSLKETARANELLSSNLAHEIKTPLTSIVAYSDYISKKDISGEELHRIMEYIRKEGQRISALSDTILKWAAVGRCNIADIKPCRPDRIIGQAVYSLTPIAESRNVKIEIENHTKVIYADEALIVSLIINLCKNALEASDNGGRISLTVRDTEGSGTEISVRDCGIGIEKHELKKITEPFYMVDRARDKSKGGSGLGLPFCLAVTEAHKGKMKIESVFGEGTYITVNIPAEI